MAQRQTLPVLPLRGTVIFPGLTAPIAAGRPGTLRAIEAALRGERLVFAVAQRDNTDEPTPDILYHAATAEQTWPEWVNAAVRALSTAVASARTDSSCERSRWRSCACQWR